MSLSGTDVLALACILGGASVSGGATAAALDAHASRHAPCAVVATAGSSRAVVVGRGEVRMIDLSPGVHLRSLERCAPVLEHQLHVSVETVRVGEEVEARLQRDLGRLEQELRSRQQELQSRQAEFQRQQAELQSRQAELRARQEVLQSDQQGG